MPVLKRRRSLGELNPSQVTVVGIAVIALALIVAFNLGQIQRLLGDPLYEAEFAHAGGLRAGDEVRVSGMPVGRVVDVRIEGNHVTVSFQADGITLGDRSEAAIKTASVVGGKFLALSPHGSDRTDRIPLERTSVPYDLTEALGDFTETTADIEVDRLAEALIAVSETLEETPENFSRAIVGVEQLATIVADRDEALEQLIIHASSVSGVLASRSDQITSLMSEGSLVLSELIDRQEVISTLLAATRDISEQLSGLVDDNAEQLGPALDELDEVITVLRRNEESITFLIDHMGGYTRNLGEAVGGGPFFYGYVHNLVPTNLIPLPIEPVPELDGDE